MRDASNIGDELSEPIRRLYEVVRETDPDLFDGSDPDDPDYLARIERTVDEHYVQLMHPEAEFRSYFVGAEGGQAYIGRDGMVAWYRDMAASFSSFRRELLEQDDVAEGVIVVHQHVWAVGRGSGVPLDTDAWMAVRLEGDRFRSADVYIDRDAAFAAAEELARSPG